MFVAFGDSHRSQRALDRMADVILAKEPEFFVHTGDNFCDFQWMKKRTKIHGFGVRGNCDGGLILGARDEVIFKYQGKKILLVHGHMHGVKISYDRIYYYALQAEADAVIFGHSHVQYAQEEAGIWLINPGSISMPRGGSRPGFALISFQEEKLVAELVSLD